MDIDGVERHHCVQRKREGNKPEYILSIYLWLATNTSIIFYGFQRNKSVVGRGEERPLCDTGFELLPRRSWRVGRLL